MRNNVEQEYRIRLAGSRGFRSVGHQSGIHCVDVIPDAEPVSKLSAGDKQSYYTLLKRVGVPKEDARRALDIAEQHLIETPAQSAAMVRELALGLTPADDRSATSPRAIKEVIGHFQEVINHKNGSLIPAEHVVFEQPSAKVTTSGRKS